MLESESVVLLTTYLESLSAHLITAQRVLVAKGGGLCECAQYQDAIGNEHATKKISLGSVSRRFEALLKAGLRER